MASGLYGVAMAALLLTPAAEQVFSVYDYGAHGDGRHNETAIQVKRENAVSLHRVLNIPCQGRGSLSLSLWSGCWTIPPSLPLQTVSGRDQTTAGERPRKQLTFAHSGLFGFVFPGHSPLCVFPGHSWIKLYTRHPHNLAHLRRRPPAATAATPEHKN